MWVWKRHVCEKHYVWNSVTYNCKNGKYLASFMDDSEIMCDKVIEPYAKKTKTNFNEKKQPVKHKRFFILLVFLLITTALLITVSIYCCLIKYRANRKYLLPFHFSNNKLKKLYFKNE